MKVGFVGTPRGMTDTQCDTARALLVLSEATELHVGGCPGADEQAIAMAAGLGLRIVCHPTERASSTSWQSDEVRPLQPGARRDADIVSSTDLLIAAPKAMATLRSRVWRTVRVACAAPEPRPHVVVSADGSVACGPPDTLACFLARDAEILGLLRRTEPLDAIRSRCLGHRCG